MSFRACVYPSADVDGVYVAHCLELDLIGEGATPQAAIAELIQAIEIQIGMCDEPSQFFFPAPGKVWKQYNQGVIAGRAILQRVVEQAMRKIPRLSYTPQFETVVGTNAIPTKYLSHAMAK